jgi:hypothetical protein
MAHVERGKGYEEEASSDDDLDVVESTRKGLIDADEYIESKFLKVALCRNGIF